MKWSRQCWEWMAFSSKQQEILGYTKAARNSENQLETVAILDAELDSAVCRTILSQVSFHIPSSFRTDQIHRQDISACLVVSDQWSISLLEASCYLCLCSPLCISPCITLSQLRLSAILCPKLSAVKDRVLKPAALLAFQLIEHKSGILLQLWINPGKSLQRADAHFQKVS